MKKSAGLYLSAREASAELAISPATLYAYVSRGLIRSEPSSNSRSHRYRAEDVRGLKERRAPSPEPRGLRNFDADLPVMDSAIATITEDGPIYRGVNCVDLAEKDTLEHAATLLWDVTGVDPFAPDNCPLVSDEMRAVAEAASHVRADRSHHRRVGAGGKRRSAGLYPRLRRPRDGRRPHPAAGGRDHAERDVLGQTASSADRQGMGAGQQIRRRSDPPRAGAARGARTERLDLYRAVRGIDRLESL